MLVHGALIVPVSDYGFVAVDARDGSVRWETKVDDGAVATAALHDGAIQILDYAHYWKFDPATGKRLEKRKVLQMMRPLGIVHVGRPAFWRDLVFAADASGILFAYAPAEDRVVWSHRLPARTSYAARPQVGYDRLWIPDDEGGLHVFALT